MPTTIKLRRNALAMATWEDPLLWYAEAVGEMKGRPLADPTSWKYQTAIHGLTLDPRLSASSTWQQWTAGETFPSTADQQRFWSKCQHSSWFFLPWHRMYLGYFEQIVGSVIVKLGGPKDWALPYWNYNAGTGSRKLPDAFTAPNLSDGRQNPLFETHRKRGNDGKEFIPEQYLDLQPAFQEPGFAADPAGGSMGFGGPITTVHHLGGNKSAGALETQPHNLVHDQIGDYMGDPDTAAYDPIFWLHHANIDRIWEVWLGFDTRNTNPTTAKWLSTVGFEFKDSSGGIQKLVPKDILNTSTTPFYYRYDDTSPPPGIPKRPSPPPGVAMLRETMEEPIPEMVGASPQAIPLGARPQTIEVRLFPTTSAFHSLLAREESHFQRAYLHVENVRGSGKPPPYDVYLNIPEREANLSNRFRVGTIPTFGLAQASIPSERHPGNGLRFTFNVTRAINTLIAERMWNPELLSVTFAPQDSPDPDSSIEVGRISLYYA